MPRKSADLKRDTPYTFLAERRVYGDKRMDIKELTFLTELGELIFRRVPRIKRMGVAVFPVTEDFRTCLVSEWRPVVDGIVIGSPAGWLENRDKNDLEKRARLELRQETGYSAEVIKFLKRVLVTSQVNFKLNFMLATGIYLDKLRGDKNELVTSEWLLWEDAYQKAFYQEEPLMQLLYGFHLVEEFMPELRERRFSRR